MMNIRLLNIILLTIATQSLPLSALASDPIPSKIVPTKGMDTVDCPKNLNSSIAVNLELPASFLYPEWSNDYANKYSNVLVPDSLVISMDHFCFPTPSTKINDIFGYRPRRRRIHYGLDLKVEIGDTIYAAFDGRVRIAKYERRGYGHYLVIRHPNGLETFYAHLSKKLVKENEIVYAGQPIALGGNSGRSTGSHLHFETRILGKAIDPALLFDFPNHKVLADTYVYHKDNTNSIEKTYYKVKSGDTLSKIAIKNATSINTLCKLNGLSTRSILRIGQTLRIN